jgi:hypothetical protein
MVQARKLTSDFLDDCMVESGADETQRMLAFMWYDSRENVLSANLRTDDVTMPEFCNSRLPCKDKRDCIELNKLIAADSSTSEQRQTQRNYIAMVSALHCRIKYHHP